MTAPVDASPRTSHPELFSWIREIRCSVRPCTGSACRQDRPSPVHRNLPTHSHTFAHYLTRNQARGCIEPMMRSSLCLPLAASLAVLVHATATTAFAPAIVQSNRLFRPVMTSLYQSSSQQTDICPLLDEPSNPSATAEFAMG